MIAVCTLLCAGESFNDMEEFGRAKHEWFKSFLALPNGILFPWTLLNGFLRPSILSSFWIVSWRWTQSLRQAVAQEIVALDGNALRLAALACLETVEYNLCGWKPGAITRAPKSAGLPTGISGRDCNRSG